MLLVLSISTILSIIAFTLGFKYQHKNAKIPALVKEIENQEERHKEFCRYISVTISTFHGTICSILCILCIIINGYKGDDTMTLFDVLIISFISGYFIVDSYYGYIQGYNGLEYLLHHLSSMIVTTGSIYYGRYTRECIVMALMGEITSPILNCGNLLEIHKIYPDITLILRFSFLFTFIPLRLTSVPIFTRVQGGLKDTIVSVNMGAVWSLSMYWSWRLIRMAAEGTAKVKFTLILILRYSLITRLLR